MAFITGQATATSYTSIITATVINAHEQEFMPYELTNTPTNLFDVMPNVGDRFVLSNGNYFEHYAPSSAQPHGIIAWVVREGGNISAGGLGITSETWAVRPEGFIAIGESYISDLNPFGTGFIYPESDSVSLGARYAATGMVDNLTQEFFNGSVQTNDPYEQGGASGTGGGTGTFSGTGDAIAIPSLPTLSAVDAGFITLFNPSIEQLKSLSSYMWSGLFDIDGWRKIFADPMNAILGLSIVPVNVPTGGGREVKVGNISTGVTMTVAASQYVSVDCGTIDVKEFWGAYLDYDPYTKAEIYLPYIGTHALAVDDIMGKSVHVVYHVDVLSGACCAYVQCGGTVLYTFIGQCSSSIPITGDNWTNVINGAISIAGSIGSMVATGGASAPMAIGNIASTAVNTMKPSVEKSGAMGGTGGMMGVQTPYLILTRPRQALPASQNTFTGYPSFITEKLSTLSGYTEVFKIHLENIPATEQELSEIETLLKSGVIF